MIETITMVNWKQGLASPVGNGNETLANTCPVSQLEHLGSDDDDNFVHVEAGAAAPPPTVRQMRRDGSASGANDAVAAEAQVPLVANATAVAALLQLHNSLQVNNFISPPPAHNFNNNAMPGATLRRRIRWG